MVNSDPTDDDLLQASAVILVDFPRRWEEMVGPSQPGPRSVDGGPVYDMGYVLRIPADSTDADTIQKWRERIHRLRDNQPPK